MKSANTSIIAGIALMAAGVLLLLDLLGILDSAALVWPLIFAGAGTAFVVLFVRSRDNWWAAIPGSVFLGLAAVILITQLWPGPAAYWAGAFLFLFMGAGFGAVYARERSNWWALIPCGVMLTLALVVALPPAWEGMPVAAVLFLGLAATFAGLSLVPVQPEHRPGPARRRRASPPSPGSGSRARQDEMAPGSGRGPGRAGADLRPAGHGAAHRKRVSSSRYSWCSPAWRCWSTPTATAPAATTGCMGPERSPDRSLSPPSSAMAARRRVPASSATSRTAGFPLSCTMVCGSTAWTVVAVASVPRRTTTLQGRSAPHFRFGGKRPAREHRIAGTEDDVVPQCRGGVLPEFGGKGRAHIDFREDPEALGGERGTRLFDGVLPAQRDDGGVGVAHAGAPGVVLAGRR